MIKKHIPNILTLLNLLSGTIAVLFAVNNHLIMAAGFVLLGIIFDFFDGFAARKLKVQGELGLQLDSLADVVTSGVVPGIVMFQLMDNALNAESFKVNYFLVPADGSLTDHLPAITDVVPVLGLLLTLGAAYRLAKFNIDDRQADHFIGLPTPAMGLFVISLPFILAYSDVEWVHLLLSNIYVLIFITLLLSYLMNSNIALFSLKFKDFSAAKNWVEILFLFSSVLLLIFATVMAVPVIILLYILFSMLKNGLGQKEF